MVPDAFVLFNRAGYIVPYSHDGSTWGRVRDHNLPIEVDSANTLGKMSDPKMWPKPCNLPPNSIVVVKGRQDENTSLKAGAENGPFQWYARVVIKDNKNPSGNDSNILRLIPKSVCVEFLKHIAKKEQWMRSRLITMWQPTNDNVKPFPVQPNGFKKIPNIKTEAVSAQRAKKDKVEEEGKAIGIDDEVPEKATNTVAPAAASASSTNKKHDNGDSKRNMMPMKSEKKATQSDAMSLLAGKKKQAASEPADDLKVSSVSVKSEKKEAVDPGATPASAPAVTDKVSSMPDHFKKSSTLQSKLKSPPTSAAGPTPTPGSMRVGSKRPAPSTEAASSCGDSLSGVFKKVKRVDCASRDNTTVFWVGNSLFVGEF